MSDEVEMTPITPEEGGAVPPKVDPAAASAPTVKLKPVIRKPMIRKPVIGGAKPVTLKPATGTPPAPAAVPEAAAAEAPKPTPVKSITSPIPAQAILHKTGIIAEGILTPAQAQAAKTKTSRISLESAIGVAPTMKSSAPMKTIKLRRPTDIPSAPGAAKPAPPAAVKPAEPTPAPAAAEAAPAAPEAPAAETPADAEVKPIEKPATVTQKKTLKLQRPGFKRPTVGGLRRPGSSPAAPADPAAAHAAGDAAHGDVADLPPVGDIPDLKPIAPLVMEPDEDDSGKVAGAPAWLNVMTVLTGLAALVVLGFCTWTLFREAVGPAAGPNDLASFHSETDYRR